jgi:hypothetical protein
MLDAGHADDADLDIEAADLISTLEHAVDAFADICDELGCERDNEAGLQAANSLRSALTAAEAKIARMGEALKPFASEASRYGEYGDGSQRAWLNCTVADLRAARSALQSEDREGVTSDRS